MELFPVRTIIVDLECHLGGSKTHSDASHCEAPAFIQLRGPEISMEISLCGVSLVISDLLKI